MKKIVASLSLFAVSLASLVATPATDLARKETPITIMPLGDSITALKDGYRYPLMQKLTGAGYRVEFVGSMRNGGQPDSPFGILSHEGHGGKTVQFIAENMREYYTAHPADVLLIHAGHNQFADQKPIPGVVAATREIITTARAINPKVVIFLAQVITSGKLPKYSYIPELNVELAKLAAELNTPEQPIYLVDQAEGFDWTVDTTEDKVHPVAAGGEKMAQKWFQAIEAAIPAPQK